MRSLSVANDLLQIHRISFLSLLLPVLLSACNLTAATPTPVPTPDIPRVDIREPANNRQVVEGVEFDIDIVARDEGAGISRVELLVDGELLNDAQPVEATAVDVFRVTMNWLARDPGLHVLEAIAYRPDGTASDPAIINIEVLPDD
jgi:hypothetical protein